MEKMYLVKVYICDDYEYAEDRLDIYKIDSLWRTRKAAKDYINSLKSYKVFNKTRRFLRSVKTSSYRTAEVMNIGYGKHTYVHFDIEEMEVKG